MNFVNSKTVQTCTKFILSGILTFLAIQTFAWEVDFSRRELDFKSVDENRLPASVKSDEPMGLIEKVLDPVEPSQDVVILNTENGFVPETIHLKKNGNYKIHIVNVNSTKKNVSFVLDAFSENHNTLFGVEKSFQVMPKTDGIFSYQCPETGLQGKMVIYSPEENNRKPASK